MSPTRSGAPVDGAAEGVGDVGLATGLALVNRLAVAPGDDPAEVLRDLLAVDPPSVQRLTDDDVPALAALAARLRRIGRALAVDDVDKAAPLVNELLSEYSAHPHLAEEDGRWVLHHHPAEAAVVPMWTAITADAFARVIGSGNSARLGECEAVGCGRLFYDESKNASRRFCSTTCQNRVKAAAFRARRRAERP